MLHSQKNQIEGEWFGGDDTGAADVRVRDIIQCCTVHRFKFPRENVLNNSAAPQSTGHNYIVSQYTCMLQRKVKSFDSNVSGGVSKTLTI